MTDTDEGKTTLTLTVTPSELRGVQALAGWWQGVCRANGVEVEPDTVRAALEGGLWLHGYWSMTISHAMANADEQPVRH